MKDKPVVAVAMSGGVDSSVAAALLVEQGYRVIGLMLKLWNEAGMDASNRCCTPDSMAMARRVAAMLSVPFYVLDARQIFYDSVVVPYLEAFGDNLTPNPCILCNKLVRWDFLLNHAKAMGADFLATGHYARLKRSSGGLIQIARGVDPGKDQSYVLHVLTQPKLGHALFPLGEYTKPQIRQMAVRFGLPVADRPDSQDLCFIGGSGDYRQFIARHAPGAGQPGEITDKQGIVLGQHPGLAFFTLGQRKGIRIASPEPYYVIEKDAENNRLVVGRKQDTEKRLLYSENVNWIAGTPPDSPFTASIQVRYKAHPIPGNVKVVSTTAIRIELEQAVSGITPGQAVVLYNDDVCLGGGTINTDPLNPTA